MTVLSSREALRRIRNGDIYLSPILDQKEQIGPISIDLRLGHVAMFVQAAGLSHVDPRTFNNNRNDELQKEQDNRQKFTRAEFKFGDCLLLHPGSLTLVPTLEWVRLPDDIKGVVTARSSWAREGLNIATANFINPGYNGIVTLELANFGHIPIALYPGVRIAQIAFYKVASSATSKQQGQFNMSFEPRAGNIGQHDDAFLEQDSAPTAWSHPR